MGHHSVSVTFVDYGGTEELSLKEVFELPSYGFRVQTLSQKFCLAHLPQIKRSNEDMIEIRECFAEAVRNKTLLLKVTQTEGLYKYAKTESDRFTKTLFLQCL